MSVVERRTSSEFGVEEVCAAGVSLRDRLVRAWAKLRVVVEERVDGLMERSFLNVLRRSFVVSGRLRLL